MPLGLIPDDGYTEKGRVVGVPGLYPELRFSFRPMTIGERTIYAKGVEKLSGLQMRRFIAGWIRDKLVDWDLKDAKNEQVKITVDNVMKLKSRLFERLFNIVSTEEASDEIEEKLPEEVDEDVADIMKAAETGKSLAEVKEERQAKN